MCERRTLHESGHYELCAICWWDDQPRNAITISST
ncbi:CPCC family cysteine-rich protein [Propionicicella superfundia]